MKSIKLPVSELMCSDSALVPHPEVKNAAMQQSTVDRGLKGNNITIEMMRDLPELSERMDDLDRAGAALKASKNLSNDVKKVVSELKSRHTNRNISKNTF